MEEIFLREITLNNGGIDELQTIVRDYCRNLTAEEESNHWSKNINNLEKEPFCNQKINASPMTLSEDLRGSIL
jgi:hypothetical protein